MKVEKNLEQELMTILKYLTQKEQDSLQVLSAQYIRNYEKIKKEKIESLKKMILEQIKFYGRRKEDYMSRINALLEKYSELIEEVIKEYNTRFVSIGSELQDNWNNQKIAFVNEKISVEQENEEKRLAAENKANNYEILIQESLRQLEECKNELSLKLNELFYDKNQALALRRVGILDKIINIFTGKSKVEKFVFSALETEYKNQKEVIGNEVKNVAEQTIKNLAIIKEGQLQTQKIFNNMLGV